MKKTLITAGITIVLIVLTQFSYGQNSKIVELPEDKTYKYISYHENGQIEKEIGFYAKKPYKSIQEFESKLKDYKIKRHGPKKEFYPNGQLKEIVVYQKGKVVEFAKNYFEDGELFSATTDELVEFQFKMNEQNLWFARKIQEVEEKNGVNLEGKGMIVLEISHDGTIKSVKARASKEENKKFLIEIGEQIEITKPAVKDGKNIGTRFSFKLQL